MPRKVTCPQCGFEQEIELQQDRAIAARWDRRKAGKGHEGPLGPGGVRKKRRIINTDSPPEPPPIVPQQPVESLKPSVDRHPPKPSPTPQIKSTSPFASILAKLGPAKPHDRSQPIK